jgi:type VI secretion system protein ImpA
MVETERESVARPILQQMVEKIEAHRLEEWEDGETVALPLALLYRCLERLDDNPAYREELYERVCRLDPVQALRFSSGDDVAAGADETAPPDAGADAEEPAADDGA